MEYVILILAVVVGIPAMAIMALAKSSTNQRELADLRSRLDALAKQVALMRDGETSWVNTGLAAEPPPAHTPAEEAAPEVKPEPAHATFSTPPEQEPAPNLSYQSEPRPTPRAAADMQKIESALTSQWLVWLGAIAIGLAGVFLVKYAIDNALLTPAMRVVLGFLLGVGLALGGEVLRRKPLQKAIAAIGPDYVPPALTASGLFVAFSSVYAAYALYHFLPPVLAFVALALFIALSGVGLSLLQGRFVALIGLLGAFVTPALVSTNEPSAWTLFSYLLIVEFGCLALSRYRDWSWFALATLIGTAIWPMIWMVGEVWHDTDALPIGTYLLLSASAYFFLYRWGWSSGAKPDNWFTEFSSWDMSERVVGIAGVTIAFLFFVFVAEANHSLISLVLFGLTAAVYLYAGRREAVFDALSIIAGVATVAVIATMPVQQIINLPDPVVRAPIALHGLAFFERTTVLFGLLFGLGGFVAQWGARRAAIWAGVSALVPVSLLAISYWRVTDFGVDLQWAGAAAAVAAACLFGAERVERHRAERGLDVSLGLYAAGVVGALSLAFAMVLREAWLTVALSLQLPALGWISQRINARAIRHLAGVVVAIVLVRLALNFNVLSYPATATSPFNWILYGYGLPAIACYVAAQLFRTIIEDNLVLALQAASLAFFVLLVSLEIRLFTEGSLSAPRYELLDQSLQSIAWLSIGLTLRLRKHIERNLVIQLGSRILVGVAASQIVLGQLLASNPLTTGEPLGTLPIFNILALAYLIPAIMAFVFAAKQPNLEPNHAWQRPVAAGAGLALVFAYLSFEVRRAFHGTVLSAGVVSDAELYTYSAVWLIYAAVVLGLGIRLVLTPLRYAGLAILMITAAKVFLIDMSGMTGLYRVASFLGLGLSLVGIGYLYQRFVNVKPAEIG